MRLWLEHPRVDGLSCENCQRYIVGSDWEIRRKPHHRTGLPIVRPPGEKTPCDICPKIPEDEEKRPSSAIVLTDRHRQTLQHYLECKAVGQFPEDWIVRRNARLIQGMMESIERMRSLSLLAMIGRK